MCPHTCGHVVYFPPEIIQLVSGVCVCFFKRVAVLFHVHSHSKMPHTQPGTLWGRGVGGSGWGRGWKGKFPNSQNFLLWFCFKDIRVSVSVQDEALFKAWDAHQNHYNHQPEGEPDQPRPELPGPAGPPADTQRVSVSVSDQSRHRYVSLCCDDAAFEICLGLGTKSTWWNCSGLTWFGSPTRFVAKFCFSADVVSNSHLSETLVWDARNVQI